MRTALLRGQLVVFFIVKCGIGHFLCACACYAHIRRWASSSPSGYPRAKFHFCRTLRYWASLLRKIGHSVTHPVDATGTEAFASESVPPISISTSLNQVFLEYFHLPAIPAVWSCSWRPTVAWSCTLHASLSNVISCSTHHHLYVQTIQISVILVKIFSPLQLSDPVSLLIGHRTSDSDILGL